MLSFICNIYVNVFGNDNDVNVASNEMSIENFKFHVNFFNSNYGVRIYMSFVFIMLLIWITLFMITPISAFISFSVIPFIFFLMGSAYFKSYEDEYHLKIHKILIYTIIFTIISLLLYILFYIVTGANIQFVILGIVSLNILASYGLFFNALGEGNIIDFIINICTNLKNLISKY